MIYLYNCYGGTHSSIMAAAIHLNKLPKDRVATKDEILNLEYFNKLNYKDMGRIIFHGIDEEGAKVYTVGRGTSKVLIPCINNLICLFQKDCGLSEKIILSNMSPAVAKLMTVGGFFSRGLHIDSVGVPLLVAGTRHTYNNIIYMVENTKKIARSSNEAVVQLDNRDIIKQIKNKTIH